ncbi:zinc-dependent alcohol dehydrogenase family protein [Nakamurella sp. A5-74]|uniref:Zinc-dependent alcohol dehydrogenase family protein n=1 Tax=Nakamurella sp. A5-74 TaxID=3158264 RepID=A0AAU8DRX2_9ACTN
MKAVLYTGPREFSVTDIPVPDVGPSDVLIEIDRTGVCGTDLHLHEGGFGAVFPLTTGHETVGTVAALGDQVGDLTLGEQVTVNPNIPCGRCQYCLSGRTILCGSAGGLGANLPGFFAEYACVDARQVFSVEGLDPDTAVFTEPAACAMHGLETLDVRPGSSALVIGAGPTGQLLAQLIGSGGASSVTVAGPSAFKLAAATALGASATVQITRDDPAGNIAALTAASPRGDGYDIVVEATGATAVGDICVPLTRNGGTVLVYGVTGYDDLVHFSPYDVFRREITIKGSFAEMTSFGATIDALRAGRVRTDGLITHRFGLDDYGSALEALRSDPTAHKVIISSK